MKFPCTRVRSFPRVRDKPASVPNNPGRAALVVSFTQASRTLPGGPAKGRRVYLTQQSEHDHGCATSDTVD